MDIILISYSVIFPYTHNRNTIAAILSIGGLNTLFNFISLLTRGVCLILNYISLATTLKLTMVIISNINNLATMLETHDTGSHADAT